LDHLIKDVQVVDGTSAPWFRAHVGIEGDEIRVIRDLSTSPEAGKTIDSAGLVLCPGFIDPHCHSDLWLLRGRKHTAKVLQGVTTEVIGSDGFSFAPLPPKRLKELLTFWGGVAGPADPDAPRTESFEGYLECYEDRIVSNVAPLVGHGTLRLNVLGWERSRARPGELEAMGRLLRECLEQGAWGMSTGLTYPPCAYADTEELKYLARILGEYGALYVPHERYTLGDKFKDAMRETIEVARYGGCPAYVDHLFVTGLFRGRSGELLKLVEEAREKGVDVTFNQHPYDAAATALWALLPAWLMDGGPEEFLGRIADPEVRRRVAQEMSGRRRGTFEASEWESIFVGGVASERNRWAEGLPVGEAASRAGKEVLDFVCDLLVEENLMVNVVIRRSVEEDIPNIFVHPLQIVCSDGILFGGKVHPRGYGTFPKAIREYWRERGLLTLEQVVHKMTGATAASLGLEDRGLIKDGFKADIVIFAPERIRDTATYEDPVRSPEGIEYVFVNGRPVVEKGKFTGKLAGRVLRRNA